MSAILRENVTVDGVDVQWSPARDRPLLLLLRMASRGMGIWDPVWNGLDELASHRTPTLIVAHEDRWHAGPSVDMVRRLADALPDAALATLEGYEAPEAILAAAEPFYARQREEQR